MYLDDTAQIIRKHIPPDKLPDEDVSTLLCLYAVLLRAKGVAVTQVDVHDAWSAWMSNRQPDHESLVPHSDLAYDVQKEDQVFVDAIRAAAQEVAESASKGDKFSAVLFPYGPPNHDAAKAQALDLYKIMVGSSESLVTRRQAVNTFFLTINGVLLTGYGLVAQNAGLNRTSGVAILVLAVAGIVLCGAWGSLIKSFGQLNRGKFKVINEIERYLSASIYSAEWEALGRGEDPKVYRSFTSREIWVPWAVGILHAIILIFAILAIANLFGPGASVATTHPR